MFTIKQLLYQETGWVSIGSFLGPNSQFIYDIKFFFSDELINDYINHNTLLLFKPEDIDMILKKLNSFIINI